MVGIKKIQIITEKIITDEINLFIKSPPNKNKKSLDYFLNSFGRGSRTRTHTGGFGDRCATIDTIPLNQITLIS